jgi:hypothetical protein
VDHKEGSLRFPDIVFEPYGLEVKLTKADSWESTGNSIRELSRDQRAEIIYKKGDVGSKTTYRPLNEQTSPWMPGDARAERARRPMIGICSMNHEVVPLTRCDSVSALAWPGNHSEPERSFETVVSQHSQQRPPLLLQTPYSSPGS